MKNFLKIHRKSIYLVALPPTILLVGLISIKLFLAKDDRKNSNTPQAILANNSALPASQGFSAELKASEPPHEKIISENTINSNTKIIYEYHYLKDGAVEKTIEFPPYFLLNKTQKSLEYLYSDWHVVSFNSDEIVMKKDIDAFSTQSYIVGVLDGFLTIFYTIEINGSNIMDITNIPISSFSEEEQEKLIDGIYVWATKT